MKIDQITGLRGVVAFLIAYALHWVLLFQAGPDLYSPFLTGLFSASMLLIVYSPNVFFVLSGYLIHQSYNNRIAKGEISFGRYILPKIRKIYPLVIVTMLVTWGLQNLSLLKWGYYPLHADGGEVRNSVQSLILSILGMQSGYISDNDYCSVNGPAWFVSILFLCYVIYFLITKLFKNKCIQNVVYSVFVILGIYILCTIPNMPLLYSVNGRGYYSFFAGVLMKEVLDTYVTERNKKLFYMLFLFAFVGAMSIFALPNVDEYVKVLVLAFFFWPSLVYLVIHGFVLKNILALPCFVWLGKISMPIFLCNFPTLLMICICDLYFGLDLKYTNMVVWIVHVIISLVIALAAHYIFEVQRKKHD